ncbi:retrovirus-related pol polyprotein from transposon TNT 1-94 [Tanacetum coccineum]
MNQFCQMKGIKREFGVARTPQQNGVAERKNRTLIEAARTMLADSLLPTTFWAEAINTACYVQNRVLITKPHNKTPYELLIGIETNVNAWQAGQEKASDHEYILLPFMPSNSQLSQSSDDKDVDEVPGKRDEGVSIGSAIDDHEKTDSSTQDVNTAGPSFNTANANINTGSLNINTTSPIPNDPSMTSLEETGIFDEAYDDEDVGAEVDLNNLETTMNVSLIPTTRIHKDHPKDQIIGDPNLATQTSRMIIFSKENAMTLVDLPNGKRAIGTKWVFRYKKDKRGIVVRNKARLVAQGYTQEEGIDYDEIDVKSAFLYGTIEEEVYVCQPLSLEDPQFPDKVYKVKQKDDGILISQDKFQVTPKVSHLHAVKRIFIYLKGQPKLSLWYPRDLPLDLEAFSNSDYAGASLDRKSQQEVVNFLAKDETVYKEWKDRIERAVITTSSLKVEQDSGNINRTQSMATLNEPLPQGTSLGSGPRRGVTVALLEKTDGSEGFHQIVDFLNASHIRFALSKNPTIYDYHIKQFWQTATVNTLNNGNN